MRRRWRDQGLAAPRQQLGERYQIRGLAEILTRLFCAAVALASPSVACAQVVGAQKPPSDQQPKVELAIATRAVFPTDTLAGASDFRAFCVSAHTLTAETSVLRVYFSNARNGIVSPANGGAMHITDLGINHVRGAGVVPSAAHARERVTFSNGQSNSGDLPNALDVLASDWVTLKEPAKKDEVVQIVYYVDNAGVTNGSIPYNAFGRDTALGDIFIIADVATWPRNDVITGDWNADLKICVKAGNCNSSYRTPRSTCPPVAITGMVPPSTPAVAIVDDSIGLANQNLANQDNIDHRAGFWRGLPSDVAMLNFSVTGARLLGGGNLVTGTDSWYAMVGNENKLFGLFNVIYGGLGINDLNNGKTAGDLRTGYKQIPALFPKARRFILRTFTPNQPTDSADYWTTEGAQTAGSGQSLVNSWNRMVRRNQVPGWGPDYIDPDATLGTSANSGIWRSPGSVLITDINVAGGLPFPQSNAANTTTSTPFTAGNVGQTITLTTAGRVAGPLNTVISTVVDSKHITFNLTASSSVTNGTAWCCAYTVDGLHPSEAGYAYMVAHGLFSDAPPR